MNGLCKLFRLLEVGLGGFEPQHIYIRGIGETAGNRLLHPGAHDEKSLGGTFTGDE